MQIIMVISSSILKSVDFIMLRRKCANNRPLTLIAIHREAIFHNNINIIKDINQNLIKRFNYSNYACKTFYVNKYVSLNVLNQNGKLHLNILVFIISRTEIKHVFHKVNLLKDLYLQKSCLVF